MPSSRENHCILVYSCTHWLTPDPATLNIGLTYLSDYNYQTRNIGLSGWVKSIGQKMGNFNSFYGTYFSRIFADLAIYGEFPRCWRPYSILSLLLMASLLLRVSPLLLTSMMFLLSPQLLLNVLVVSCYCCWLSYCLFLAVLLLMTSMMFLRSLLLLSPLNFNSIPAVVIAGHCHWVN
jgi:hypothetical protein